MKMTSRGCCVLLYDRSREQAVHSNEPRLPRTDVSGSEFEVGAPTSEEEAEKKNRAKRVPKSPLTAVLESWLFSILHCRLFWSYQLLISRPFPGDAETLSGVSGNEDVSTGVETDGKLRGRHIVVTRSLDQEPGTNGWGPQHDVPEVVQSRSRSRELLEQAFGDGNICVQMRNLLVFFHVDSKFLPHFCFLGQFVTDPAATVNRAIGHQLVSLCRSICEEEKVQLLSPFMKS